MTEVPENTEEQPQEEKELTLEEKVLQYFVDLFKRQRGLRRRAGSKVKLLERNRFNPKLKTFDVYINDHGSWQSRRVTVGPIGEESGSKSSCFYAIYDNKLVVKVPPTPLTDFETYVQNIQRERRIVEKLAPRESITPGVAVILKKIQEAPKADSEEKLEALCTEWLRENPEYQQYLMIDGAFAYFMDLSRYIFLADAVSLFHGAGHNLAEEMLRDPTIIDDFDKFEGRYGLENAQIGMDLQSVYQEFEDQLRTLMIRSGVSPALLLHKKQHWFFLHVAGRQVEPDEQDMTAGFVGRLNKMLAKIISDNQDVIDEYRQMVDLSLRESTFSKHKMHMAGVVANVLELLAWLQKRGVAIRDIKPDNLLVAGDPDRYPNFLSSPEAFSIGLIDVETAVDFLPADGKLRQPQLGGTPFYATPHHMFGNKTLAEVYPDLPRVFYLQDWFATVAMIYGIIIGEYLFGQTAKQLAALTRNIQKAFQAKQPPAQILKQANLTFWRSADNEFAANMKKNEDALRGIQTILLEPVQNMLIAELDKENTRKEKQIKALVARQQIFKNQKNREQLLLGSADKIAQIIVTLKKNERVGAKDLALLENIRVRKASIRQNRENTSWIQQGQGLSIYNLLEIMMAMIRAYLA
ncbi:MAG: hypothetical protein ACLFPD_02685 [Desulfosudaceae bacterium]